MEGSDRAALVKSMGLSAEESLNLTDTLNKHAPELEERKTYSSDLLETFYTTARQVLGTSLVNTPALDQALVEGNWSQACISPPSGILLPSSAEEVSRALTLIRLFRLPFAVRGGGHSPNPGWSSIAHPGVLLDLQRLSTITISPDAKTVGIGAGQRWGPVMDALDARGVSVVGARSTQVGVPGLVLGGGFFHTSQEYGLAADNVVNFEVVLSDGRVVDANPRDNPELFWALRGGGSNFGVVTRFDMRTVPVRDVFYEVRVYAPDDVPALLDCFAEWQKDGMRDRKSTVGLIVGLDVATLLFFYAEHTTWPAVFSGFDAIKALQVVVPGMNGTCASITALLGGMQTDTEPTRHDYRAASFRIDAQLYKDVHAFWRQRALSVREKTGATQTFVLQPIPLSIAEKADEMGGNPMGLPREDHTWWTTLVNWKNADDDEVVRAVPIAVSERWKELGKERGLHLPYLYMNDAARDQNPLASYGEQNVKRLKEISRQYDRDQIFQTLQSGGFLLSNA